MAPTAQSAQPSFVVEVLSLTLRWGLTLVLTALAAIAACALFTDLNRIFYGQEEHILLSEMVRAVPGHLTTTVILTVPTLCAWSCARESKAASGSSSGRCCRSWSRSIVASIVGGALLGAFAAPPPGPYYMREFEDADVRTSKQQRTLADRADGGEL
eukprot:TRINITY_DN85401_c0_g1_i1.p1 TRINITY_DN85401_c0_g1~~TRINITY_DN85401_c0_g1_i1.p1  ORF type:complete len:167 (-),score=34.88 TRINITY_DN85401_c0_g1_i1:44-514(-)